MTPETVRRLIDLFFSAARARLTALLFLGQTSTAKTSLVRHGSALVGKNFTRVQFNSAMDELDLIGHHQPKELKLSLKEAREIIFQTVNPYEPRPYDEWSKVQIAMTNLKRGSLDKIMSREDADKELLKMLNGRRSDKETDEYNQQMLISLAHLLISSSASGIELEFKPAPFLRALMEGHWILLDEINLAREEALGILYGLLTKGYIYFDGRKISPKENGGMVFAAGNLTSDIGRNLLSEAFESRVEVHYTFPYTPREEAEILKEKFRVKGIKHRDLEALAELRQTLDELSLASNFAGFEGEQPVRFTLRNLENILEATSKRIDENDLSIYKSKKEALLKETWDEFSSVLRRDEENLETLRTHFKDSFKRAPPEEIDLKIRFLWEGDKKIIYLDGRKTYGPGLYEDKTPSENRESIKNIPTEADVDLAHVDSTLEAFAILLKGFRNTRKPTMQIGPAASGKTDHIAYLCRKLGWAYHSENMRDSTLRSLVGGWAMDPQTHRLSYEEGILIKSMRLGWCLVLEEVNFLDSGLMEVMSEWIDEGHFTNPVTGDIVDVDPRFRLHITLNPVMGRERMFTGRNQIPMPFRNRFIERWVDEKSPKEERDIIMYLWQGRMMSVEEDNELFEDVVIQDEVAHVPALSPARAVVPYTATGRQKLIDKQPAAYTMTTWLSKEDEEKLTKIGADFQEQMQADPGFRKDVEKKVKQFHIMFQSLEKKPASQVRPGVKWEFNRETGVLEYPLALLLAYDMKIVLGMAIHESLHKFGSYNDAWIPYASELTYFLFMGLEDPRVEYWGKLLWPGYTEYIDALHDIMDNPLALNNIFSADVPNHVKFVLAVKYMGYHGHIPSQIKENDELYPLLRRVKSAVHEAVENTIPMEEDIDGEIVVNRDPTVVEKLFHAKKAAKIINDKILPIYKELIKKRAEELKDEEGEGEGEGEGVEQDGEGEGESDPEAQGEPDESAEPEEGAQQQEIDPDNLPQDIKDKIKQEQQEHMGDSEQQGDDSKDGKEFMDAKPERSDDMQPPDMQQMESEMSESDEEAGQETEADGDEDGDEGMTPDEVLQRNFDREKKIKENQNLHQKLAYEDNRWVNYLSGILANLIREDTKPKWLKHQSKGKEIDWDSLLESAASGFADERIWEDRIIPTKRSIKFTFIVDESDSMKNDQRGPYAIRAVRGFVDILTNIGVDFNIRGYGSNTDLHKGFMNQLGKKVRTMVHSLAQKNELLNEINAVMGTAGSTNGKKALKAALDDISHYGGDRNIVIIATDGEENGGDITEQLERAYKMGVIVIALGIGPNVTKVAHTYDTDFSEFIQVENIEELPLALKMVLKRELEGFIGSPRAILPLFARWIRSAGFPGSRVMYWCLMAVENLIQGSLIAGGYVMISRFFDLGFWATLGIAEFAAAAIMTILHYEVHFNMSKSGKWLGFNPIRGPCVRLVIFWVELLMGLVMAATFQSFLGIVPMIKLLVFSLLAGSAVHIFYNEYIAGKMMTPLAIIGYFKNKISQKLLPAATSPTVEKIIEKLDAELKDSKAWEKSGENLKGVVHNILKFIKQYKVIPDTRIMEFIMKTISKSRNTEFTPWQIFSIYSVYLKGLVALPEGFLDEEKNRVGIMRGMMAEQGISSVSELDEAAFIKFRKTYNTYNLFDYHTYEQVTSEVLKHENMNKIILPLIKRVSQKNNKNLTALITLIVPDGNFSDIAKSTTRSHAFTNILSLAEVNYLEAFRLIKSGRFFTIWDDKDLTADLTFAAEHPDKAVIDEQGRLVLVNGWEKILKEFVSDNNKFAYSSFVDHEPGLLMIELLTGCKYELASLIVSKIDIARIVMDKDLMENFKELVVLLEHYHSLNRQMGLMFAEKTDMFLYNDSYKRNFRDLTDNDLASSAFAEMFNKKAEVKKIFRPLLAEYIKDEVYPDLDRIFAVRGGAVDVAAKMVSALYSTGFAVELSKSGFYERKKKEIEADPSTFLEVIHFIGPISKNSVELARYAVDNYFLTIDNFVGLMESKSEERTDEDKALLKEAVKKFIKYRRLVEISKLIKWVSAKDLVVRKNLEDVFEYFTVRATGKLNIDLIIENEAKYTAFIALAKLSNIDPSIAAYLVKQPVFQKIVSEKTYADNFNSIYTELSEILNTDGTIARYTRILPDKIDIDGLLSDDLKTSFTKILINIASRNGSAALFVRDAVDIKKLVSVSEKDEMTEMAKATDGVTYTNGKARPEYAGALKKFFSSKNGSFKFSIMADEVLRKEFIAEFKKADVINNLERITEVLHEIIGPGGEVRIDYGKLLKGLTSRKNILDISSIVKDKALTNYLITLVRIFSVNPEYAYELAARGIDVEEQPERHLIQNLKNLLGIFSFDIVETEDYEALSTMDDAACESLYPLEKLRLELPGFVNDLETSGFISMVYGNSSMVQNFNDIIEYIPKIYDENNRIPDDLQIILGDFIDAGKLVIGKIISSRINVLNFIALVQLSGVSAETAEKAAFENIFSKYIPKDPLKADWFWARTKKACVESLVKLAEISPTLTDELIESGAIKDVLGNVTNMELMAILAKWLYNLKGFFHMEGIVNPVYQDLFKDFIDEDGRFDMAGSVTDQSKAYAFIGLIWLSRIFKEQNQWNQQFARYFAKQKVFNDLLSDPESAVNFMRFAARADNLGFIINIDGTLKEDYTELLAGFTMESDPLRLDFGRIFADGALTYALLGLIKIGSKNMGISDYVIKDSSFKRIMTDEETASNFFDVCNLYIYFFREDGCPRWHSGILEEYMTDGRLDVGKTVNGRLAKQYFFLISILSMWNPELIGFLDSKKFMEKARKDLAAADKALMFWKLKKKVDKTGKIEEPWGSLLADYTDDDGNIVPAKLTEDWKDIYYMHALMWLADSDPAFARKVHESGIIRGMLGDILLKEKNEFESSSV